MKQVKITGSNKAALALLNAIKTDKFSQQAELAVVKALVESYWPQLQAFDEIFFFRNGADVEIRGGGKTIAIEVKASNRKAYYFNKNGVDVELWGNALKHKDIDLKTGLIKADFLVFGAADVPGVRPGFDFWVFTRDELATLHPRVINFIPSHIPTLMKDVVKTSHFDDQFNSFMKGAYVIVLPQHDGNAWTGYPTGPHHGYVDNWCPLLTAEYTELSRVTLAKLASGARWDFGTVFTHTNVLKSNPNFKTGTCAYYQANPADPKCRKCKAAIGAVTPI
jgi:hypothetical protein